MKNTQSLLLLAVIFTILLETKAQSTQSLESALNTDGTLKNGISGSFNAEGYEMHYGKNGEPVFQLNNTQINQWNTLTSGITAGFGILNPTVLAVAVSGNDLYVGGNFAQAGGILARNIARFNTLTNTWSALTGSGGGNGVNGLVRAIAVIGNQVFLGGDFTTANVGGDNIAANRIVRYFPQTGNWGILGVSSNNGANTRIQALTAVGNDLYVGGELTSLAGVSGNRIFRYNTETNVVTTLGSGIGFATVGFVPTVYAIAVINNVIYAGGSFTTAGGSSANNIARFSISQNAWQTIGSGTNNGVNGEVYAMTVVGSDIYVGGGFTQAGGNNANSIARLNTQTNTWSTLGTGTDVGVRSIAVLGSDVYVSGDFTTAGGNSANRIARFNTQTNTWSALGTGVSDRVTSIAMLGNDVYIGGLFTTAGGNAANRVARWVQPNATNTQSVTSSSVITFTGVGVSISFSGVSGTGTCTVQRYDSPASNVSFSSATPTTQSRYRFVITASGFTFTNAELRFNRTQIPNASITNAQTITVYRRADIGAGTFAPLPNAYNASFPNEVRATTSAFSEFIFGSNDNQLPVDEPSQRAREFVLSQNYPNPFNPVTVISYQIPAASEVSLKVYDALGREVSTLVQRRQPAGTHQVQFNASGLSSGMYFYKLQAGTFVETKKMMLVK